MCAVFRFWMYSYVLSYGVRIRFWVCRLPESWMGPNFCVATARPGPSATPVAPSTQQMASRMRRFDIPPPSCGSPDAPEGRQRQLFGYRFEDHLHGHPGPETARRDVAQVGGEAHARILDDLDQGGNVGHAIAGKERPVHGDPGEEAGRAPGRRRASRRSWCTASTTWFMEKTNACASCPPLGFTGRPPPSSIRPPSTNGPPSPRPQKPMSSSCWMTSAVKLS